MVDIKIRFLSGTRGEAPERTLSTSRVVIGRRLDCDVVLHAGHVRASGHHLAIFEESGRLWVEDLRSRNGTFVNGRALAGRIPLGPADRVTVGPDGPVFSAEIPGAAIAPREAVEAGAASVRDTIAIDSKGDSIAGDEAAPLRTSVGLETMTELVHAAVRRERRRSLALVAMVLCAGAVGVQALRGTGKSGAELEAGEVETHRLTADARVERPAAEDFRTVLASAAASVYVVVKRTERAGDSARVVERGIGTAWSIRDGWLATNAHVADLFASLGAEESLIARSNAWPPVDLRILGVRAHPGYEGFSSLIERIRPYDKSSREVLDLPPAFDVALLEVAPEDVGGQAPALRLASEETLYALQAGQPIAFVGFPGEGLVRGGTDLSRPSAKTAIGSLNRVIDPFFGRAEDPSLAQCLEYNIEVVGGASGSPIVNDLGEVIGLINAGDVISETSHGRVGTGGTSYGPRADTIRALVDGEEEADWARLRPGVEARMLEIFRDGSLESEEHAGQIGVARLGAAAARSGERKHEFSWTFKDRVRLETPGVPGRVTLEVPVGEPGLRALIVIAEGQPLAVRVEGHGRIDRDRLRERSGGADVASTVDLRLIRREVGDGTLRVDVWAEDDGYFAPGEVAVYALRLD
ncbi:FHA domain protein [Planctomycetes bacterium Poly30]|uniref:FHA domain protein n=1 Tax=Saltatorellus ferox TaxID=2528018 RepID=A0A518EKL4_9BACT|nr:FHA domain protein [Planctomycetes bacterium Poly30]